MRTSSICVLFVLSASCSFAQYPLDMKFDYNWTFGYSPNVSQTQGNSLMRFNAAGFDTAYYLAGKNVHYYVQCATISDTAGNLVLHSNGFAIYNSAFQKVPGADSLNCCNWVFQTNYNGGYPNIDGMILINRPGSLNEFWLINKAVESAVAPVENGISYALRLTKIYKDPFVQFTMVRDSFFYVDSLVGTGLMELNRHANGRDWWLVQKKYYSNTYLVFLIQPDGIHYFNQFTFNFHQPSIFSQSVFSPDGNKFIIAGAHAQLNDSLFVTMFDFDRCTGTLSNPQNLYWIDNQPSPGATVSSGCAVSPNSKYLYVASTYHIFQFDITVPNWQSTKTIIATYDNFIDSINFGTTAFAFMQLAPDNKIYITGGATRYLNVIESPNEQGTGANVCQHCFKLPAVNSRSVPNFPNYRLGPIDGSPCDTLGIDNIDNVNEVIGNNRVNSFNLYPNPATDYITLFVPRITKQWQFALYDIQGREVLHLHSRGAFRSINISHLAQGMYLWKLLYEDGKMENGKVVISY